MSGDGTYPTVVSRNNSKNTQSNPLYVFLVANREIRWDTSTAFDKGSHSSTEVSGDLVQLEEYADNDDDILYNDVAKYTLSDSNTITVDYSNNNKASLKPVIAADNDWPFTAGGNYTYDGGKIEVTGGVAKLKGVAVDPHCWYHLNAAAGATVTDSSTNGRDGTATNMEDADWVAAKLNNGLRFDGTNEYVDCGTIAQFERTTSFSIECWAKTSTVSRMIMSNSNGTKGWELYIAAAGTAFFSLNNNISGGNRITRYSTTGIAAGAWVHIVVTYDGSSTLAGTNMYINGSLDNGSGTDALSATTVSGTILALGRRGSGTLYYNGDLDEVVIYEKELTSTEVSGRYNSASGTETMTVEDYDTSNPDILTNTGLAFTSALDTFTETATKPGSDEIKYVVSSDNGASYEYYSGGWVASDSSYAQANTASDVDSNISTLAGSGTFKFKALLHSDDGETTPELDNIYIAETATYSTTDDLYADTKDTSQIAPATILSWLTTTITNTKPANTDIRVLFSTDGRSNWQTYTGGSWQAPASATTRTDATSITDAVAQFGSLAKGSGTLDVRLFLYSSDNAVTPDVDNINVTSDTGFATSGTYTSNSYNTGYTALDYDEITYAVTLNGGTATFKVRTSPDGAAWGSWSSAYASGDDVTESGKHIQWKVDLTGSGVVSPEVSRCSIFYDTPDTLVVDP